MYNVHNMTLVEIGKAFNRNHATIINGLQNAQNTDVEYKKYARKNPVTAKRYLDVIEVEDVNFNRQLKQGLKDQQDYFIQKLERMKGMTINETLINKFR